MRTQGSLFPPILNHYHPPPPLTQIRYKEAFQVYIRERVLPALRDARDEGLLKQLWQRWQNHKARQRQGGAWAGAGSAARPAGSRKPGRQPCAGGGRASALARATPATPLAPFPTPPHAITLRRPQVMVRWLSRFFNYLDRYYIQRHNLHSLNDVGLLVFRGEGRAAVCGGRGHF